MTLKWSGLLFLALLLTPRADACTAFVVYRNGQALAGNNEDFWLSKTKVWIVPSEGNERGLPGEFGRIYFGFSNYFPQGGMNEAGLFFDGFATEANPIKKSNGKRFDGNLIDYAMANCETVAEIVHLLKDYDLSFLSNAMLMFADPIGDSVIVEGDKMIRIRGDHQITTNFYQSEHQGADGSLKTCPCRRYQTAKEVLQKGDEISVEACCQILNQTRQSGAASTQYSNVYDLQEGLIYLYHFSDFKNPLRIDLADELEKGTLNADLPDLFPAKESFTKFVKANQAKVKKEIESRWDKSIDPSGFDAYVGRYAIDVGQTNPHRVSIALEDDQLILVSEGERQPIYPAKKDGFFFVGDWGPETYTFQRDDAGKVTSFKMQIFNTIREGKKVD